MPGQPRGALTALLGFFLSPSADLASLPHHLRRANKVTGGMQDLKEHYRSRFVAIRRALPETAVAELSRQVVKGIASSQLFERCTAILLYSAIDNEVDPVGLRHAADAAAKPVYYPRVPPDSDRLTFFRVARGESLKPGRWGIGEPTGRTAFPSGAPALIIVPGVAFDAHGTRLGRGGGYYDRTLRQLGDRGTSIGLAFSLQLVPSLPRETHDEAVRFVAIETEILPCARARIAPRGGPAGLTKEAPWLYG
jgi:5-formyltetrahydrofolate cyclo-ligase